MRVKGDKGKSEEGKNGINQKGWELLCYLPIKVDALNSKIMAYRKAGKGTKMTVRINLLDMLEFSRDTLQQLPRRNARADKRTGLILNQTKNKA